VSIAATAPAPIRTTVPARLDRLNWSPFHTRMVAGLGAAWILDGLQITIASSVTGVLTQPDTLGMTSTEVGLIASIYLIGQLIGALVFGGDRRRGLDHRRPRQRPDRFGRHH
jgi:MFS family permease